MYYISMQDAMSDIPEDRRENWENQRICSPDHRDSLHQVCRTWCKHYSYPHDLSIFHNHDLQVIHVFQISKFAISEILIPSIKPKWLSCKSIYFSQNDGCLDGCIWLEETDADSILLKAEEDLLLARNGKRWEENLRVGFDILFNLYFLIN